MRHSSLILAALVVLATAASACKPTTKPNPDEEDPCDESMTGMSDGGGFVTCDGWQPYDDEEDAGI